MKKDRRTDNHQMVPCPARRSFDQLYYSITKKGVYNLLQVISPYLAAFHSRIMNYAASFSQISHIAASSS